MAKRAGEIIPGLVAVPKLAAIDDYRKAMADARRRTHDGHRWQAKALGMDDPGELVEGPMGNLIVTGDVYGSDAAEIISALQRGEAPPTMQQSAAASTLADFLKKAALAAVLTGSGAGLGVGIPWLLGAFDQAAPPAAVESIDTDTQYELRLGPGETP